MLIINLFSLREYDSYKTGAEAEYAINPVEFIGYITDDDKLIVISSGKLTKAEAPAPFKFNGRYYLRLKDAPTLTYAGIITNRIGIFIPIKATIHSHNPQCKYSGQDRSMVYEMSGDDIALAYNYPSLKHYVITCDNVVVEFTADGFSKPVGY